MNRVTVVGVIGLGAMGTAIAGRLDAAGHDVRTWNRTPPGETTPADVARASEVVLIIVSDPAALAAVTEGEDGVAAGADATTTVIQMSTVSPEAIARLQALVPRLLDVPMHGGPPTVEKGEAAIYAGGDPALIDRWTPLLSELGTVTVTGGIGTATAAKLMVNASLFGVLGVLGETLALADHLGLDRDTAFAALATTPLAAQAERRRPAIEAGDYPSRFGISLARKDAELVHATGIELPILEATRAWLAATEAADPTRDYTAILGHILNQG